MRKLIFISFLAFSMQSCIHFCDNCDILTNLIVENKSNYNLVIKAYIKGVKYDEIAVLNGKSLTKNVNLSYKNTVSSQSIFITTNTELNYLRDSIVIVFNNKKIIKQYCNGKVVGLCTEIPNNLDFFRIDKYKTDERSKFYRSKKQEYIGSYKVTFTNDDYEKANNL